MNIIVTIYYICMYEPIQEKISLIERRPVVILTLPYGITKKGYCLITHANTIVYWHRLIIEDSA